MNPQTQVTDAFGTHLHWPDGGEPRALTASASHIGCPLCGQSQPCPLCEGTTWVSMIEYILYKTNGLKAVLEARARVRRAATTIEESKEES